MAQNYVLLERIELNQSASSVTFSNIPQTGYTDLKIVVSARGDAASAYNDCYVQFNGNASNYSTRSINGDGSSATSNSNSGTANSLRSFFIPGANATASTFGNSEIYIPNYASGNYKSTSMDGVTENNGGAYMTLRAGLWSDVSAITSATIIGLSTNFVSGSTFSLYGIAAVGTTPVVAPKADGGNIIATDGTYWYHAFLSNGTFTPQVGLNADVLVVAGGGGGGCDIGGGGGAGGFYGFTSQALSSANYTVTIGSGGAGGTSAGIRGNNGVDSSFGSLTPVSVGGGGGGGYNSSSNGFNGGSGGGAAYNGSTGGTGTTYQGKNGGAGNASGSSGGGGGAGVAGGNAGPTANDKGKGGDGLNTYSSWATATSTGVSGYYAGGGGGAGYGSPASQGGAGGGGIGGSYSGTPVAGTAGTTNTGSGGGGGSPYGGAGGNGGSGIVIVRYLA